MSSDGSGSGSRNDKYILAVPILILFYFGSQMQFSMLKTINKKLFQYLILNKFLEVKKVICFVSKY